MQLAVLCVIVLVQSSYITATPHGYGVKGGAVAKADASAAAGASSGLGPIPLGVPLGAGFSGSYSKSSSSSSSSSSASSSSSSFSYSGSGLPSVGGGCSTGVCQNSGSHDKNYHGQNGGTGSINGNQHINYNQGFPVSAGAAGQAGATVSAGQNFGNQNNPSCTGNNCLQKECKGSDCNSVPTSGSECEFGRCEQVPFTHSSPSSFDNKENGCISGNCDTSVEQGSKHSTNFNVDSSGKCQSGHCETAQKCSSGHCGPLAIGDDTSPNSAESFKITTPHLDSPIKGAPDNEDINVNLAKNTNSKSNYNNNNQEKAAANVEIPTNCAFGKCAPNPPLSTSHDTSPYSPHNTDTSSCNSPNCKNNIYNHAAAAGSGAVPGYNKPETHLTVPKQEPTCVLPHCKPTNIGSGYHPSGSVIPVSVSQPNLPYENKKQFDCAGGQCGNNQQHPNNYNSGQTSTSNDLSSHKPTSSSQTPFLPEINTPAIIPDKSSGYQPIHPHYSSPVHNHPNQVKPNAPGAPKQDVPYPSFVPLSPTNSNPCSGSSCPGGLPTVPHVGSGTVPTQSNFVHSGSASKPSISSYPSIALPSPANQPSNTNKPAHESLDKPYKGGFGGPPGLLKPNDFSLPQSIPHAKPIAGQQPSVTCSTGNCHSASNHGHINNNGNSNAGSVVGSFGGPPGLLKPHDYNLPNSVPVNKPVAGQQPSSPCSAGNCHSAPSQGHLYNHGNSNAGAVVGGFGGSPGLLKPNDFNVPSSVPLYKPPTGQQPSSVPCSGGNCHSASSQGQLYNSGNANGGSVVGGFGGPPGFLKPNDYNLPHSKPHDKPIAGQQPSVTCSTGNCHSTSNHEHINNNENSNAGSVVSSFGGPPGLLKPHDYNLPNSAPVNKPVAGQEPSVSCSSGNCHSAPGQGQIYNNVNSNAGSLAGGFGGSPGLLKPNDYNLPSSVSHTKPPTGQFSSSVPCSGGNCHNAPSQGQLYNSGNTNAGSVAGGFGASQGFLKPNDYNLPSSVSHTKPPAGQLSSSVPCSGGNCHNAPSQGQLYNSGNSNAGSVAGGFGASPGFLKPNDYNLPSSVSLNKPLTGQQPSAPCSTGNCHSAHNQGQLNNNENSNVASTVASFGGPPGLLKPNDYTLGNTESLNKPIAGQQPSGSCTTGNCNSVASQGLVNNGNSNKISTSHGTTACATGNCGLQSGNSAHILNGAHASAAASATAAIYTGGFGGPPGFLKPYDDGNVKAALASLGGKLTHSNAATGGINSNGPHSNLNTGAGGISQAFAAAGASAGVLSGHPGHYNHEDGAEHKSGRGCSEGCSASGNGSHNGRLNSYLDGGFASLSAAKAGAISGANAGAIGFGGSFASSSASAHASAGAGVKGYGRR